MRTLILLVCLLVPVPSFSVYGYSQTNPAPTGTPAPANGTATRGDSELIMELAKLAGTFVLGFFTAICAEPLRRWLFRSAVSLRFEPRIGFGRGFVSLTTTNRPGVMAKYIRVLAKCSSRIGVTANRCKPYLKKIEKLDPQTGDYKELHHDPIPLNWAYIGDCELNIDPEMKFYFDIAEVYSNEDILRPQTTIDPATWADLFRDPARYRFSVVVSGENIRPEARTIEFDWKGSFDSLTETCF